MDYRLQAELPAILNRLGLRVGEYDLVSLAGSAKGLLAPWWRPWERWTLLRQIRLAQKLHGITSVLVLAHDDCGAYGIADWDEENETQKLDLSRIRVYLRNKFLDLKIQTGIILGTATGNLHLE